MMRYIWDIIEEDQWAASAEEIEYVEGEDAVRALEAWATPDWETNQELAPILEPEDVCCLFVDGILVAAMAASVSHLAPVGQIDAIHVKEEFRGRGAATALMVLWAACQVEAEVSVRPLQGCAELFKKAGFTERCGTWIHRTTELAKREIIIDL